MRFLAVVVYVASGVAIGLAVANALFVPHGDNRAYFMGAFMAFACCALAAIGQLIERMNRTITKRGL